MPVTQFRKLFTEDKVLNRVQNNISDKFSTLDINPLIDARLLENVSLASGANVVNHRLGRRIRGYIVVRRSANVGIHDSDSSIPDRTINLTASGAVVVSLIVF